MSLIGKTVRELHPDTVSSIMRSDDTGPDALYPSRIGVNCDECWTVVEDDFIVSDRVTKAERFEIARKRLRRQGWSCTEDGDLCGDCATPIRREEP